MTHEWNSAERCVRSGCEAKLTVYIIAFKPRLLYGFKCPKCDMRGTWESLARKRMRRRQVESYVEMHDLGDEKF